MKKITLTTLGIFLLIVIVVTLVGMYKFNYLASQPGYDVDGNKIENPKESEEVEMSLGMKTWTWVKTSYNNDTEITPNQPEAFTLTFTEEGMVSATTDCNAISGTYSTEGNQITFGPLAMTKKYCPNSQEQDFAKTLSETQSFFFTSKGELVFDLKFDSGSAVFE
jgi:heat shock protein HslJ